MKYTMFIKLNSSCQLIDNKCVILVNGIEYVTYWLLEYFEFIEILHRFINEIIQCQTSGHIYVEVESVL